MLRLTLAVREVKVKAVCDRAYRHGVIAEPDFGHYYDERELQSLRIVPATSMEAIVVLMDMVLVCKFAPFTSSRQ